MKHQIDYFNPETPLTVSQTSEVATFLVEALGEYGDPKPDVEACLAYALDKNPSCGGLIATVRDLEKAGKPLIGCVVYNRTGMHKYIPENILVYIATDQAYRGQGIGKRLIEESLNHLEGSVALHCEPQNPARRLYERLGFVSKYVEMRLLK